MQVVGAAKSEMVSLNLRNQRPRKAAKKYGRLCAAIGVAIIISNVVMPSATQTAVANGDTRTLNLYHSHTGESISATFRRNGSYDPAVLDKLNWFLRDWRNNDPTKMDPRLFDVVWEVYRTAGANEPVVIFSAYRSPETNAMLRRRSSGVAEYSLHMRGMAMDTTLPGMSMEKIREIGMRFQRGGVGYYPSSNFVHLDVGNVRSWPRMSYDQLARLFPDGKSVHLASNGRALPRFEEARAEIAAHGGVAAPMQAQKSGNLFAWLFGNKNEEDESEPVRSDSSRRGRGQVQTASLNGGGAPRSATEEDRNGDDVGRNPTASRRQPVPPTMDRGIAGSAPVAPPAPAPASLAQDDPARAPTNASRTVVANLAPVPGSTERRPNPDQVRNSPGVAAIEDKFETERPGAVPMPPPRPQDRVVLARAFIDAPEPPLRPERLVRVAAVAASDIHESSVKPATANDAIGDLIGKSKPAEPMARAANLPVVITQGPKDRPGMPAQVLAYAESVGAPDFPAPIKPAGSMARSVEPLQTSVAAARLDRSNFRSATSQAATATATTQSLLGPAFTGLRQAARISPDILSPVPSIGYASVFAARATNLDCANFTGAATKPLETAPGLVRIMESSLRLRGN